MLSAKLRPAFLHSVVGLAVIISCTLLIWDTLPPRAGSKAWWYTLGLLGGQLGAMVVVAVAIGVSTVLFQTVTANRILTPSIIGFDSLYLLIQTLLLWTVGSNPNLADSFLASTLGNFIVSAGLMIIFAMTLYTWLLVGRRTQLATLLLVGLVFGLVFRSLTGMFQRMLDPAAFLQLQSAMFANFSYVDTQLLIISAIVVACCAGYAIVRHRYYDVMLLGRDAAISLGVDHKRETIAVLFVCTLCVSAATALVGPVLFFGIIIANAAYQLLGTQRHRHTLPMASALGVLGLVAGQFGLRQLNVEGSLSIVIEFVGGLFFLGLLLKGRRA